MRFNPLKEKHQQSGGVVFEDIDVVVFEKPSGMLSYPLKNVRTMSAIQFIRKQWKIRRNNSRNLYLIHRLDLETSGLMVFAKTTLARRSLASQFHQHSVIRGYLAVTNGIPHPSHGTIRTMLGRRVTGRRGVTAHGKLSITNYVVRQSFGKNALVYCSLRTGRTHQVRIHLAHLETPVVGDHIYGKSKDGRLLLHSHILGFHHPRSNSPYVFLSSVPKTFRSALKELKR